MMAIAGTAFGAIAVFAVTLECPRGCSGVRVCGLLAGRTRRLGRGHLGLPIGK
jgi:hypothetical protein